MRQHFLTLEGYDDPQDLEGFFSRLKQAFTPPRAVRKVVQKAATAVVKSLPTVGKAVRIGALAPFAAMVPWAPKLQRAALGLSDNEMKYLDIANKVNKGVQIAVATVVGGPAIMAALAPAAGAAGTGSCAATAAAAYGSPSLSSIMMSGGAALLKNQAAGMLYKLTMGKSGEQQMESFDLATVPDAASIPNNVALPVMPAQNEDQGSVFAPYVAGSGGLRPGGEEAIPRRAGDSRPYDPMALLNEPSAIDESSVDPGNFSDADSSWKKFTPMQDALMRGIVFDTQGLKDLLASSQAAREAGAGVTLSNSDGSYSLKGLLAGVRHGVVKRSPGFIAKPRRTSSAPGSLTSMVRKGRANLRVSRATARLALGAFGSKPREKEHIYATVYGRDTDITPTYYEGWPTKSQYDNAKARKDEIDLNPDTDIYIADRAKLPAYAKIVRDYELFLRLPEARRQELEVNQARAGAPDSSFGPVGKQAAVRTAADFAPKQQSWGSIFSITQAQPS